MTRHRSIVLTALLLVAALCGGLVLLGGGQFGGQPGGGGSVGRSASAPPVDDATPAVGTPAPASAVPRPTPTPTVRAPAGKAHVDDRYRARYGGTYAGWDDLLDDGTKLPKVTAGCRADWQRTSRDDALNWDKASFVCLAKLTGNGFKPQGIGGSGSTSGYRIGGRPAGDRDIVVVSSYSSMREKGLLFPHEPGRTDTTRLTVIDLDRGRYNTVELVRPGGDGSFTALDSHGSGLAWAGQYLYTSSRTALWMYNADDLMRIDGRYVLPAVARWSVAGQGGLSTLGIDRAGRRARLIGINYSETGTAWSQSFDLDSSGLLRRGTEPAEHVLSLIASYGPGPAAARSTRSAVVPGTNYQGIGTTGPYRLVNSSSLMLDGRRHGDNLVIFKRSTMIARFSMPSENVESLYVDYRRDRYVTITEHGRQFLFWLPLDHLVDRAER